MSEARFADGFIVKDKHPSQPEFVKCKLSIKKAEFLAWLEQEDGEWVNLQINRSREGKLYASVDDFVPKPRGEQAPDDSIPF